MLYNGWDLVLSVPFSQAGKAVEDEDSEDEHLYFIGWKKFGNTFYGLGFGIRRNLMIAVQRLFKEPLHPRCPHWEPQVFQRSLEISRERARDVGRAGAGGAAEGWTPDVHVRPTRASEIDHLFEILTFKWDVIGVKGFIAETQVRKPMTICK